MVHYIQKISYYLTAGAIGALVNSIIVWAAGAIGLTIALGAKIAPAFTPPWLYQRLTWGALWGLLFFLPIKPRVYDNRSLIMRGFLVSLLPSLAQLLYFFPVTGKGLLGWKLGFTVPLFVILFNAIWGVVAAAWIEVAKR